MGDLSHGTWWREKEFLYLALLALAVHVPQLNAPSVRGEESRWARVGIECQERGDWVVPRQQGEPFLSRPPLRSWLTMATAMVTREVNLFAIRFPSLVATFLTVILIYAYARSFLGPLGALAAGSAFATMVQVLELGCRGETEAVYTFLVASSLLLWHMGDLRGWSPVLSWSLAYLFTALATLAKGPQAMVYFAGPVGVYLLCTRRWRELFYPAHFAGILVFVVVLGAWLVPFVNAEGWDAVYRICTGDVALRFQPEITPMILAGHLLRFPLETLACALPWSLWLLWLFRPGFSRQLRAASLPLGFASICLVVALLSCWFVPFARPRFLMPLYPCLAVIVGAILETAVRQWKWGQAPSFRPRWAVLFTAGAIGAINACLVIPWIVKRSNDPEDVVAGLVRTYNPGSRLVSFGPVWHQFAYHYRDPIALRDWPRTGEDASDIEYFCFDRWGTVSPKLPFAWVEVAIVPGDRYRQPSPNFVVVVGRRIGDRKEKDVPAETAGRQLGP